ncbi:hypothetical protein D3C80_1333630 [compost metagenome]
MDGFLERRVMLLLCRIISHRVIDFMPGTEYNTLIIQCRLLLLALSQLKSAGQPTALKNRQIQAWAIRPFPGVPCPQVRSIHGLKAHARTQTDARIKIRFGDTYGSCRSVQGGFTLLNVGTALSQF